MANKTIKNRKFKFKQNIFFVVIFVLTFTASELTTHRGWLDRLDNFYYDIWHNIAGVREEPKHVVIVSIDDQTLLEYKDDPLVFWTPYFAQAIKVLRHAGAKIIGLDCLFSISPESWLSKFEIHGRSKSRTYDIPMRTQLSSGQVVLIGNIAMNDCGETDLLLPVDDYLFVLPGGLKDVGLANFYSDDDGVVRKFVPSFFDDGTMPTLTFATLLAMRAADLDPASESWSSGSWHLLNTSIPREIGFVGPPGTIPRISFNRLLSPQADLDSEIQRLKDKIIIIAAEHTGIQDIHMTPYTRGFLHFEGRMMNGSELHANIVETILTGKFPRPIPAWLRIIYFVTVLAAGTILFFKLHPLRGLVVCFIISFVCIVLSYQFFLIDWVLPLASTHLGLGISYLGILVFRLTGEERERTRLKEMFGKYVSEEVLEKLLTTGYRPNLRGESVLITVLFLDIRNFTMISERLSAHEVVEMLNNYLSRVCDLIFEEGGTVNKFIGDGVMALFGSPVPHTDHAQRALKAAMAIVGTVKDFRHWMDERFQDKDLPDFDIGIGLHTGEAVIANIGSSKRLEFTAIGDTVNIASRMENLTKKFGWTIIASAVTIKAAGSGIVTGKHNEVNVKGRDLKIEIFEVISFDTEKGG